MKRILPLLATLCLVPWLAWSEEANEARVGDPVPPEAQPKSKATQDSVRIGGQNIRYTATAGWLILKDDKGSPTARFGYTAYTRNGVESAGRRPVTFAFNGGPGSSSIWLHMGILGPRRVAVTDAGFTPPPPYERVNNEYSILDVSDLVMVDPVGTGFSKTLGETEGKLFWGVDQDIKSVGAFIKQYVTQNGRWSSPKYILGESYGGVRSAGLVWHMQSRHSMNFNGIIMVSPLLSMVSGIDGADHDLPHVLFLSALAATAWYHDAIPDKQDDLQGFVERVERYAFETYAPALMQGSAIEEENKLAVAEQLAAYTGTTADYWMRADLRVSHQQFLQELKRDERLIVGRIDGRFVGPSVNPLGESMDYDPFFPSVGPAYTAAFMDYMHNELEFGKDENYQVSAIDLDWDWGHRPPNPGGFVVPWANLRPDLAMALTTNPGLHLLVQQGYYDLATPIGATRYDLRHLDISKQTRERIRTAYYEAGHMMYLHEPSMQQFRNDLANFIRDTDRLP